MWKTESSGSRVVAANGQSGMTGKGANIQLAIIKQEYEICLATIDRSVWLVQGNGRNSMRWCFPRRLAGWLQSYLRRTSCWPACRRACRWTSWGWWRHWSPPGCSGRTPCSPPRGCWEAGEAARSPANPDRGKTEDCNVQNDRYHASSYISGMFYVIIHIKTPQFRLIVSCVWLVAWFMTLFWNSHIDFWLVLNIWLHSDQISAKWHNTSSFFLCCPVAVLAFIKLWLLNTELWLYCFSISTSRSSALNVDLWLYWHFNSFIFLQYLK